MSIPESSKSYVSVGCNSWADDYIESDQEKKNSSHGELMLVSVVYSSSLFYVKIKNKFFSINIIE